MSQVYVGNLDPRVPATDIEREFQPYGDVRSVRVCHRPPGGYAFVDFKDRCDALDAIRAWNGKYGWRVELSRNSRWLSGTAGGVSGSGSAGGRGGGRFRCYNCGEPGHFARDCPSAFDKKKKGVKPYQRGRKKKDQIASTSAWKPVPPPPPPWLELPEDVMGKILKKLRTIDILENAQKVCTAWRRICKDPAMWRVIDMWNLKEDEDMDFDLEKMCCHAVDLSQGQLVEINIEYFGTNELLEYIAQRSSQLKCIRLARCFDISAEGLSKAVKGLPHLEELHLQFTPMHEKGIEGVGQSCPMLKSFTLIDRGCRRPLIECDQEALAVAKSMPELRRLRLFGNKMTNEGLQAILDGCTKLESLDLRQCFKVELGGELGKRCAQQIKDLRLPNDSTQDCEWDCDVFDWRYGDDYPPGFSDIDSYYDYDYDYEDFDYDDFCNPYLFSGGSEDSDYEALFGFY